MDISVQEAEAIRSSNLELTSFLLSEDTTSVLGYTFAILYINNIVGIKEHIAITLLFKRNTSTKCVYF